MATEPHITRAARAAPPPSISPAPGDALTRFETIHAKMDELAAVIGAAVEEIQPGWTFSHRGQSLLHAADTLIGFVSGLMAEAVTVAHAERGAL